MDMTDRWADNLATKQKQNLPPLHAPPPPRGATPGAQCPSRTIATHILFAYGTAFLMPLLVTYLPGGGGGGVLRFGSDGGVPLKPPNQYLFLRVILAEKGTYY